MPQLMLQGFPDGAIRIGSVVSVLRKDDRITYFVGPDNYFSHAAGDAAGQRMAIATLIASRHVRVCEVETSPLGIARRNLMRWTRQLAEKGSGSFYTPRAMRGSAVMTPEKAGECGRHLDEGNSIPEVACLTGVNESTLRRALGKMVTDTVKMIAYRAETALVGLLRPHLAKEDEARALIRDLFVSAADIEPNERENTLTIHNHRMACPAHDKAIDTLLAESTQLNFLHPETQARMIYQPA